MESLGEDMTVMRDILTLAVELDRQAYQTYTAFAAVSNDADFHNCFAAMAKEERAHVVWWSTLLESWEQGLIPDVAEESEVLDRLRTIAETLAGSLPEDPATLTYDDMLDIAARFEFYMLDPVFGDLLDLLEPGSRREFRESYNVHILRLVDLIAKCYSKRGMASFLTGALKRGIHDQQHFAALAMHDQLTGLYNRRGLLTHLKQWLSWSERYNHSLGVVLVDVDRFKTINDDFGHDAGDEALRSVAETIAQTVRTSDVVGRFGGDEFVIVAPETDPQELASFMDRLVKSVNERLLDIEGTPVRLSISAGGAWVPGGVSVPPDKLIAQADAAMYSAKKSGRNRASQVISPFSA